MMKYTALKNIFFFVLLLLMAATLNRCANIMAPTGGSRDITPPKVIQSYPPNSSTNFSGNKFILRFDEYIKLEKINQQLLISPPMEQFPDIKLKGKELYLIFKETLKPNTTYSVFFGDAIADITEGNVLHNYSYIFSTGKTIDSLSLRGRVLDAIDLKPMKDISVMLYKNNNDSLPLDELPLYVKPYYISKTNEEGYYNFSGLADTAYLLFGLQDQNYSLTFDQPSEKIAFVNSMVWPQYRPKPHIDSSLFDTITTLPHDSIQHITDSLWYLADSLADNKLQLHKLFLFKQADTIQKLLKVSLLRKNVLRFVFRLPSDSIRITSIDFHPDSIWYQPEWNKGNDTLDWFLRKNHPDSLKFIVDDGAKILDTLDIRAIPKKKFVRHKKKGAIPKKEYLSWHSNISGVIKPGQMLMITYDYPVKTIQSDSILLISAKDTLVNPPFHFQDSLHRKMLIPIDVKPSTAYHLIIPDSSIIDWNGLHNKAIHINIRAKAEKEYGILNFNLQPTHQQPYIFLLLSSQGKELKRIYFSKPEKIRLENLDPLQYQFKIIFDDNDNKKWDTGNYSKKQEPEKVIYYEKKIKVRANWEISENWSF